MHDVRRPNAVFPGIPDTYPATVEDAMPAALADEARRQYAEGLKHLRNSEQAFDTSDPRKLAERSLFAAVKVAVSSNLPPGVATVFEPSGPLALVRGSALAMLLLAVQEYRNAVRDEALADAQADRIAVDDLTGQAAAL